MDSDIAAIAIADTMETIRNDVAAGNGPVIEADAVLLMVADLLAVKFALSEPGFDKAKFITACDLDEMLPSEAFFV